MRDGKRRALSLLVLACAFMSTGRIAAIADGLAQGINA